MAASAGARPPRDADRGVSRTGGSTREAGGTGTERRDDRASPTRNADDDRGRRQDAGRDTKTAGPDRTEHDEGQQSRKVADQGAHPASDREHDASMHARNTDRVPRDPLHDPRIAAGKDHTVRHFADGYATPHQPRAYLHAPDHRDVAVERAFVARHSTDFHTRYARDMDVRERAIWRAGLWRNEWHYGRRGWWWEANGVWYPYGAPVFPYPEIVADQIVYDTPTVDGPDLSFVEGAPDEVASGPDAIAAGGATGGVIAQDVPPLPPAPAGWYRCDRPDGYYPTEAACSSDWDLVQNAPLPGE